MEFEPNVYINLFLCCLMPFGASLIFYFLNRFTKFGKLNNGLKQLIIGVVFGGIAIFGTEVGVPVGGGAATANVRDAAPLCAGLIFGGPAGAIAGIIGGVERFFAAYWGKGAYSQIACSVSTIIAGFYAWGLRKFMFDNKRPSWGFGLVIGIIMEVIHLTILFFTHMDDSAKAFEVVRLVTIPMVVANSFAVFLSCLVINIIDRKQEKLSVVYKKLTNKIQIWLLVSVLVAFFAATTFVYFIQTNNSYTAANSLLSKGIDDVSEDIKAQSDTDLLYTSGLILKSYENLKKQHPEEKIPTATLNEWCTSFKVSEISTFIRVKNPTHPKADPSGYVTMVSETSNENFIGWAIGENDTQAAEFKVLLFKNPEDKTERWATEYAQEYQLTSQRPELKMKYGGKSFTDEGLDPANRIDGFIQIGYDAPSFQTKINEKVKDISTYRHVGETGHVIIADESGKIVSSSKLDQKTLKDIGIDLTGKKEKTQYEGTVTDADGKNIASFYMFSTKEGYTLVTTISTAEAFYSRDNLTYLYSFIQVIVFAILFAIIYFLIKKLVVDNITEINGDLAKIIDGDLDVKLKAGGSNEFVSLSDDINTTVSTLKHYINEAASRIDQELAFAKSIQLSALPNIFPAFPNIKEIDIFASMYTAKQVGGDFYDFYFIDSNHIGFLVSDVSGKGIPAAMFMMESKTMIKNYAMTGAKVNEVMCQANNSLCSNNGAGMFVTSWLGIMNIHTGQVSFCNAGHNPPLVYRKKEHKWSYIQQKSNLVLGGMDKIKYDLQRLKLSKGDRLFLYTDGVTEATNVDKKLYGEDRLLNFLNEHTDLNINEMVPAVKADIDNFVGDEPQFDDITMLIIELKEKNKK